MLARLDVGVGADVEVGDLVLGAVQRVGDGRTAPAAGSATANTSPYCLGHRHLDEPVGRLVDVVEAGLGAGERLAGTPSRP